MDETSKVNESPTTSPSLDSNNGLNVPSLMLERISTGGSRVLRKTLSQASSLMQPESRSNTSSSPNDDLAKSATSKDKSQVNNSTSSSVSFSLDKPPESKLLLRPRLLSPIPSSDSIPIYRGSYVQGASTDNVASPSQSRPVSVHRQSFGNTPTGSRTPNNGSQRNDHSRQESVEIGTPVKYIAMSQTLIDDTFGMNVGVRSTFGLEELRDGFFDAIFVPKTIIETLAFQSVKQATEDVNNIVETESWTTRFKMQVKNLIHLLMIKTVGCPPFAKAFIAYAIAYILCLVGVISHWLGSYSYFMCLATILHHAGHTSGCQIEIAVLSIFGGALGLAWGALAVFVSTSTGPAFNGYGGILAMFTLIIIAITSWLGANFVRLYHGIMAFSIIFLCTTIIKTGVPDPQWRSLWDIGIPYLFGVILSLLVNLTVMPDFGHRSIFTAFGNLCKECNSFVHAITRLDPDELSERVHALNAVSSELSLSYREMCNETTISTLNNKEALILRNSIQICVGRLRIIPSPEFLLKPPSASSGSVYLTLCEVFTPPVQEMLRNLADSFQLCEQYLSYLYSPTAELSELSFLDKLQAQIDELNALQIKLVDIFRSFSYSQNIFEGDWDSQKTVDSLLFVQYLSDACRALMIVLKEFQRLASTRRRWKISFIDYPLARFLKTNTRQTTHDRGGQSALYFFHAMDDVEQVSKELQMIHRSHSIKPQGNTYEKEKEISSSYTGIMGSSKNQSLRLTIFNRIWLFLHRLQEHEAKFALRSSITILLLCLPAYIRSSRVWYGDYDIWFAPIAAIIVLHPRVGGSVHDLFVRTTFAIFGVFWAAVGYRAGTGNPYVLAVFAALFMIPHFFRFIQSSHPRSGLIACLSFTLVSQSMYSSKSRNDTIIKNSWTRGVTLIIGVASPILINWIFWPFVARHEVRKVMSMVLLHLSQCYQGVADRHLYKYEEDEPTQLTLSLSEVYEARLRAGLGAYEELIQMTRHEPSLRGTFNDMPYQILLKSCQAILHKISQARISSLHFSVYDHDTQYQTTKQLLSVRRDAVASVIFCFYILAGAFRSKNKIPSHLPSAPMSRKLLFDAMIELHEGKSEEPNVELNTDSDRQSPVKPSGVGEEPVSSPGKRESTISEKEKAQKLWAIVHETSFSRTFTEIAEELEKIISYSKFILGEDSLL